MDAGVVSGGKYFEDEGLPLGREGLLAASVPVGSLCSPANLASSLGEALLVLGFVFWGLSEVLSQV